MRWISLCVFAATLAAQPAARFRAGAFETDVTPARLPITTSGSFLSKLSTTLDGTLHARAIVLDDGSRRLVIAVADSLMMPRELVDRVKFRAERATGIAASNMLVSATHTHSAPPVMGALGTDEDPEYASVLEDGLVAAIEGAFRNLAPARVGWTRVNAPEHTHNRRWITRSDKMLNDPFGNRTVRANMHPGFQNPDFVGPSGPVDPELTVMAIQGLDGKPVATLANYSMHYVGVPGSVVSADYFGRFCESLRERVGGGVAIMSQGTSGDQHWMDYARPRYAVDLTGYARELAGIAADALKSVEYRDNVTVDARETLLTLSRRLPDRQRMEWAARVRAESGFQLPRNQPEVYAREQMYLASTPRRELVLQALRIGDLGITAIPNEVYAITGLKLKAQSPLAHTMNIELANGAEGYIPPPEQHALGGYTTWPARTAGLEPEAEPKIVDALLGLLEQLAGAKRRVRDVASAYASSVLALRPSAYWRLNEFAGMVAADAVGRHPARLEPGFALYLEGADDRAVHLAGGRMVAPVELGAVYSVAMWVWAGVDREAMLFDRLGVRGGRLAWGDQQGAAEIGLKRWRQVVAVSDGSAVRVYVDGKLDFSGKAVAGRAGEVRFGEGFEGRLDEIAVWDRALSEAEVRAQVEVLKSSRNQ